MTHQFFPNNILGKHAIIDLSECNPNIVRNCSLIRKILVKAAKVAQVNVIDRVDHHFKPQGFTAVFVLEESHLSIHTWPEYRYVSIDLYSCNLETDFEAVKDLLAEQFQAARVKFTVLDRGFSDVSI